LANIQRRFVTVKRNNGGRALGALEGESAIMSTVNMSAMHTPQIRRSAWADWLAVAMLSMGAVSIAGAQLAVSRAAAAEPAAAGQAATDSFAKPDGEVFYAVHLTPPIAKPAVQPRDVVLLFDTSASQVDAYREKGLAALQSLIAGLSPQDRVRLFAVDLQAIPLTPDFVAPAGAPLQAALAALRQRVPLGSTDMEAALRTAVDACAADRGHAQSVVYIGDGMSTARLIPNSEMQQLVDRLVAAQVPVTSYAVGPRVDALLLGALANHTGGVMAVDNDNLTAQQVGAFLAAAAQAPVVWPTQVKLPAQLGEIYPNRLPPLRFDRDTILIGRAMQAPGGTIEASASINGQRQAMSWALQPSKPGDDNAYLVDLVNHSRKDGGLGLPLVGSEGLQEMRRLTNVESRALVRLARQAMATGSLDQADKLAEQALKLDVSDPEALAVRKAVAKARQSGVRPTGRELRLVNFQPAANPLPASGADQLPAPQAPPAGDLLREVEEQQRVRQGAIQADVQNTLNQARSMMGTSPEQAANMLKLSMETVRQAPELTPELRMQLTNQLENALRNANNQIVVKADRDLRRQQIEAESQAQQQINRDLFVRQDKIKQLMERFDSLMDEGRYGDAGEVAMLAHEEQPVHNPGLADAQLLARQKMSYVAAISVRNAARDGFRDSLYRNELAHVPQPDDPPVLFPAPEVWQLLTERREKYKNVDLARNDPAEVKIIKALDEPTELEFIEAPLTDVIDYLKTKHQIEIQLDNKALEEAGVAMDTQITRNLKGVTLRSALRLMLRDLELTYVIRDEVLLITTVSNAETIMTTKVYPVADLVIPIRNQGMSGFGGLGGGMGGGMGGGGMGGGGMGGGGMGGGGMGGGGGMFAVKDDLKLSSKPAAILPPAPQPPAANQGAGNQGAGNQAAAAPAVAVASKPIVVRPAPGQTLDAAWNEHFAVHVADGPQAARAHGIAVREAARRLMKAGHYADAIAMIGAALRNKQGQPWMYEALGLAMQANGAPPADIERALMSGVDFSTRPEDLMQVAQYMARAMAGNRPIEKRALSLFHQAAKMAPTRPEPYIQGLYLAQQLNDVGGIQWSTVGILQQGWPHEHAEIPKLAKRIADATLEQLKSERRFDEAKSFKAALDNAQVRDCMVVVSWTGDADVDLLVEEPTGSVCSFRSPRTTGGGVMLGDTFSGSDEQSSKTLSEVYVCPQGFNGMYKMLLRRVWGKPTVDKVTVDFYLHRGSPKEKHFRKQISLSDGAKDGETSLAFELQNGRRQEPLEQEQVANAVAGQLAVGKAILAQQLNGLSSAGTLGSFLGGGYGYGGFGMMRGAVGYQPVIITLPVGANMSATAVVSADRRYVRCTTQPLFSTIPSVNTFNYQSGSSGTSGGASNGPPSAGT
jgi:tetratricopeptide (TPR) repeat protein